MFDVLRPIIKVKKELIPKGNRFGLSPYETYQRPSIFYIGFDFTRKCVPHINKSRFRVKFYRLNFYIFSIELIIVLKVMHLYLLSVVVLVIFTYKIYTSCRKL